MSRPAPPTPSSVSPTTVPLSAFPPLPPPPPPPPPPSFGCPGCRVHGADSRPGPHGPGAGRSTHQAHRLIGSLRRRIGSPPHLCSLDRPFGPPVAEERVGLLICAPRTAKRRRFLSGVRKPPWKSPSGFSNPQYLARKEYPFRE